MATWHQAKTKTPLYHPTKWTAVIDSPHQTRALMLFSTKALAEAYMRNLAENNPNAHKNSYILKPAK